MRVLPLFCAHPLSQLRWILRVPSRSWRPRGQSVAVPTGAAHGMPLRAVTDRSQPCTVCRTVRQPDARTASCSNQCLRLFHAAQVTHLAPGRTRFVDHGAFEKAPQGGADTGHALSFSQARLLLVVLFCLLLHVPLRLEAVIKILSSWYLFAVGLEFLFLDVGARADALANALRSTGNVAACTCAVTSPSPWSLPRHFTCQDRLRSVPC